MDNVKVGAFIAECRKAKRLTQQQLADRLSISNKAVSKWETGQGMPDISTISALAEILGVTADELLNGELLNIQKQDKNYENEITSYLVNKCIVKFKLISTLSAVLSLVGLIIPYFIWKETRNYSGMLFGIWLQVCSGGLFAFYYMMTKNQVQSYNRNSIKRIDSIALKNKYLKIYVWLWTILPIMLLVSAVGDIVSLKLAVKVIIAGIVYIVSCLLYMLRGGK